MVISLKVEVKKGWLENATVWVSCVGKAGLGKTPSINNIIFPLKKINNKEIKNYIKERQKYEAYEKLDKKEKETSEVIKEPIKTQFIVNDVTLEALVELHEENKNAIGVFKDGTFACKRIYIRRFCLRISSESAYPII